MPQGVIQTILAGAVLAVFSSGLYAAQREYTVGVSAAVNGGGIGPNVVNPDQRLASFYGAYPSLDFIARGEHSSLETSYAFGYSKDNLDPGFTSNSHLASARFSGEFGPKWKLNLSETFEMTSDTTTFSLFRGVASTPEGFRFIFDPVVTARPSRTNIAAGGVDYALHERSTLTVSASHSLRDYGDDSLFSGSLYDQQRVSVGVTYTRKREHKSWSLGYSGSYLTFSKFPGTRSHGMSVGYFQEFSSGLTLRLSAGPSYVETPESVNHREGYDASIVLQKVIRGSSFSLYISQDSGDASGFASIADNRQAGLSMSRPFGQRTTLSLDATGFDTRGIYTPSIPGVRSSTRGVSASATVGVALARKWSLGWGAQFQRQEGNSLVGFEQKRLFVSLRFSDPVLWRF